MSECGAALSGTRLECPYSTNGVSPVETRPLFPRTTRRFRGLAGATLCAEFGDNVGIGRARSLLSLKVPSMSSLLRLLLIVTCSAAAVAGAHGPGPGDERELRG